MKGLTLYQPQASLVALGHKQIESRSWSTNYRGPLAIHAARRDPGSLGGDLSEAMTAALERVIGPKPLAWIKDLPRGVILAVVNLIDVVPILQGFDAVPVVGVVPEAPWSQDLMTEDELAFGDFTPGRFAWLLELPGSGVLRTPIPERGARGLWNLPPIQALRLETITGCDEWESQEAEHA